MGIIKYLQFENANNLEPNKHFVENAILEAIPIPAILIKSTNNVIQFILANTSFYEFSSYKKEFLQQRNFLDFILNKTSGFEIDKIKDEFQSFAVDFISANGDTFPILLHCKRISLSVTNKETFIFTMQDERLIEKVKQELSIKQKDFDCLVYKLSHDLRSPIASILGLNNLSLIETNLDKIRENLLRINYCAQNLDKLIQKLVQLNTINHSIVENQQIEITSFLQNLISTTNKMQSKEFNFKIVNELEPNYFIADKNILQNILQEVLENSINFSTPNDRTIIIKLYRNASSITFEVSDSGIGINNNAGRDIFKMFYKASEKSTGAGLGLFIAERLVEKIKGSISYYSKENVGTTFFITIPQYKT